MSDKESPAGIVFEWNPAFPLSLPGDTDDGPTIYQGLTKREYFATHVVINDVDGHGEMAARKMVGRPRPGLDVDPEGYIAWWAEFRAKVRYIEADAMLKAGSK